jgi:ABC-2 type transport system permease protein
VELLVGQLSPREIQQGLLAQLVWILLGFGLLTLVWARGAKRYSAVGS